jgi:DNA invertase Pin-like site-specific DNA recombinase
MIYGYARVSTEVQDLTRSTAQLKAAGCQKIYRNKITGTTADRPQLNLTESNSLARFLRAYEGATLR